MIDDSMFYITQATANEQSARAVRSAFKQAAEVARGHDCHTLEGYRYACECHLTIAAAIEELSKREED